MTHNLAWNMVRANTTMETPSPPPVSKGEVQLALLCTSATAGGSRVVTQRGASGMVTVQNLRKPIMVSQVKQLEKDSHVTGAARSGSWDKESQVCPARLQSVRGGGLAVRHEADHSS